MQNFFENTQIQSNVLHQLLSAKSTGNIPVSVNSDLLPKNSEVNSSSKQLLPSSNSNDQLKSLYSSHSTSPNELTPTVHRFQVTKTVSSPVQLNGLHPLTTTCCMTTQTNSTNAHKTSSPKKTGTHSTCTGQVWSPRNTPGPILNINSTTSMCTHSTTPILSLPTTSDTRGYAYLESNTSVVFTLEKPGGLWSLSSKQQSEESTTGDQESQSRSNSESSAAVMPGIEKNISLPRIHTLHPYQAPVRQRSSVELEDHTGEQQQQQQQQQRKEALDTYSTDERQADTLQSAWKENYASKQLLTQASTFPSPNMGKYLTQMTPIHSHQGSVHMRTKAQSLRATPVQTGLEGMHAYPARAACIPEHRAAPMMNEYFSLSQTNEEVCPKPSFLPFPLSPPTMTWPPVQPKDNVEYTSSHGQASLSSGVVNIGPAQGKRDGQLSVPPVSQSCPHMPQIMCLPVTPCDMTSGTKLATEEPLHYPSYGCSPLPYPHRFGHLPVHQQLVPIPLISSLAHSMQCPWCPDPSIGCIMNPIPQQPMPSITPEQAFQMKHWEESRRVYQYPDALDMFKTANLLQQELNAARPEVAPNSLDMGLMIDQFPQKNVIPVKLKVQDDTSMEQIKKVANKNSTEVAVSKAKKTHQCTICEKFLSRPSSLKAHMRLHTGEKPYKCCFCCRTFPQASALQTHKRSHTGEKPYLCKECQQSFSHASSLRTHKRTHTGEKPFHCTWQGCGKTFLDQSTLMKHQCVHTGEKPYACSDCGARFTQIGNRKKHQTKIHGASQGKGYTDTAMERSPQDRN